MLPNTIQQECMVGKDSRFAALREQQKMFLRAVPCACGVVFLCAQFTWAQPPVRPPANVVTAKSIEREIVSAHTFVGTVMPKRTSAIGSAVAGRVIELPFNVGERVENGQPLAQLLTKQLEIELAGAEAELRNRKAVYEEQKRGRTEEIEQSQARLAAKKAARDYTVARLERYRKATNKQVYTQDQVEEIYSTAVQADNLHLEGKIELDLLQKGAREEVLEQSRAMIAVQEQEIERIKDQLARHTIRAPFDGYVIAEHTEAGQWVTQGGLVATVVELDFVDVEIQVLERYIPHVNLNDEVRVEVTALPKENFVGRIVEIVPQADQRTRNFPVRVRLENRTANGQPLIKAGMFARAVLGVGGVANATLVPKDAIVLGGASPLVVAIKTRGDDQQAQVEAVPVELGAAWQGYIQVIGKLTAGQSVVVQGNDRLRSGDAVVIVREVDDTPQVTATNAPAGQ